MTKRLFIGTIVLAFFLISCRPEFKTKKTSLIQADIESIAIVVTGGSIRCGWLQLSDKGIKDFVDSWNNSNEMVSKIDIENSHPTLGLIIFSKNNTTRRFSTYGQFVQEDSLDFFLDIKDKDFFMKLETNGSSKKIYQDN